VIVRKERPYPDAQLRFSDIDGHRFTCFAHQRERRPAGCGYHIRQPEPESR
jgi:hypothetical protein